MKIVIAGGTGQVGTLLARAFQTDGHDVVVLSRAPQPAPWRMVHWDAACVGPWAAELNGAAAVINLAGKNVNCRYNAENRRLIKESRMLATRAIGQALVRAANPPRVWLQASTATIYAHRYDVANDEADGILGGNEAGVPDSWRFSTDVARSWEEAAQDVSLPHTRTVLLRSAMTMSPDAGGVFDVLLGLVRWRLGGAAGDGRQFVSWIHERDFIRAIYWLIDHAELAGPVNVAAPQPLANAEFMRALRAAWNIWLGLPAACWMLAVGAFFMRTETELVLKSRRVVPGRLLASGFKFDFPSWPEAAADLCARWRERRRPHRLRDTYIIQESEHAAMQNSARYG